MGQSWSVYKLLLEDAAHKTEILPVIVEDLCHAVEAIDYLEDLIGNAIATVALQEEEVS